MFSTGITITRSVGRTSRPWGRARARSPLPPGKRLPGASLPDVMDTSYNVWLTERGGRSSGKESLDSVFKTYFYFSFLHMFDILKSASTISWIHQILMLSNT